LFQHDLNKEKWKGKITNGRVFEMNVFENEKIILIIRGKS